MVIPLRNPHLRHEIMREAYACMDRGETLPEDLRRRIRCLPEADWASVMLELLCWLSEQTPQAAL